MRSADSKDWPTDTLMAAFWWVKGTTIEADANMMWSKTQVGGFSFPTLVNKTALKTWDKLLVLDATPNKKQRT